MDHRRKSTAGPQSMCHYIDELQRAYSKGITIDNTALSRLHDIAEDMEAAFEMMSMSLHDARAHITTLSEELRRARGSFDEMYELGVMLGSGGFATVYKARNKKMDVQVAAKRIDIANVSQAEMVSLREEIRLLEVAQGPNIVTLINTYEDKTNLWLVMELLQGGELFALLADPNNAEHYSESQCRTCFVQLLNALGHLKKVGIVHRDVKPENLLLERRQLDSVAKLCDFGFAVEFDGEPLTDYVGSPLYMAPEIVAIELEDDYDYRGYNFQVDVWAAGCLLYLLLFGTPPFNSRDQRDIYEGKFTIPSDSNVSAEAKELLQNILKVDPVARFSVEEVLGAAWVTQTTTAPLPQAHADLKKWSARRELRSSIASVMMINRLGSQVELMRLARQTAPAGTAGTAAAAPAAAAPAAGRVQLSEEATADPQLNLTDSVKNLLGGAGLAWRARSKFAQPPQRK